MSENDKNWEEKLWNAECQASFIDELLINKEVAVPNFRKSEKVAEQKKKDYRLPFQKERDRIVWSRSFKRLAYKSQIFPHGYSDHQRQRLTHSLEVMQLSSSLARTLGLNYLLCEAIALGHDLGHTPFGHAGEYALDNALKYTVGGAIPFKIKGLQRFTHYEQGLDVAKYMDTVMISEDYNLSEHVRPGPGLDLSDEVIEGIFKHAYDHDADENEYNSLRFLFRHTKYKQILKATIDNTETTNSGTLEAQLVRACDKISYFISDIEDGLIVGAFHINDIIKAVDDVLEKNILKDKDGNILKDVNGEVVFREGCNKSATKLRNLFKDVRKRYDYYSKSTQLYRQIKDVLITIIVNSVIETSQKKIITKDYKKDKTSRGFNLIIEADKMVKEMMSHIYKELLVNRLFKRNILVKKENNRADHIISCLFCQYIRHLELIPWDFRSRYIIKNDNKIYTAISKIYLEQDYSDQQENPTTNAETGATTKEDPLLHPGHLDLSSWFTNNRRPKCIKCPNDKKFCKVELCPAELICVKDFIAGMTNNYAEVRYQGDVDCHASRAYWKEKNMDRRKFLNFSLVS